MPFRKIFGEKGNILVLFVLLCGAIAMVMGLIGMTVILRRQLTETMLLELIKLIGIFGTLAVAVGGLLRSAANSQGIERVEQKADLAAQKAEQTQLAVHAEREQLIDDPDYRKRLVEDIVKCMKEAQDKPPQPPVQT